MDVFALEEDAVDGRQLNVLFVEGIDELVESLLLFHHKFTAVAVIQSNEDLQSSIV